MYSSESFFFRILEDENQPGRWKGLTDTIQLEPVPRNLVIDSVCLACDTGNVLILLIRLGTHGTTELVQTLCSNV